MNSELFIDIKSISIQAIEKSLLSSSSSLSEWREFCHEIAAVTGSTKEKSKKRVAYTVIRILSCFRYLNENHELKPESLKMYSDIVLQLTGIVENEWGFVPDAIKKNFEKSINNLCIVFNTLKPVKSHLSLKNRIIYSLDLKTRNAINHYQKGIDNISNKLIRLSIAINEANLKPLPEITRWKSEEFNQNDSALEKDTIKLYSRLSKDRQKEISDFLIQNIIDYVKEINPDDETIKELEEIRQFSQEKQVEPNQEIEQNFMKQSPIQCRSKTFKPLIEQVQPVSSAFDSQKAKEDYLNQKYNL